MAPACTPLLGKLQTKKYALCVRLLHAHKTECLDKKRSLLVSEGLFASINHRQRLLGRKSVRLRAKSTFLQRL